MIEQLPTGLIWRPDGHVSDWVLSALVDGETGALPEEAVFHTDSCEDCALRLGVLASAAFSLDAGLLRWSAEGATRTLPFPTRAFGLAGLLVSAALVGSFQARGTEWFEFPHKLLTLWRWGRLLAPWATERWGALSFVLSWLVVFTAVAVGFIVARRGNFYSKQEPLS